MTVAKPSDHPLPQRAFHAINLASMAVLAFTGFNMARPFLPGAMEATRYLHMVFAYVLVANLVGRIYYAFMGYHRDYGEFAINRNTLSQVVPSIRYHLLLGPKPKGGKYNPLQRMSYMITVILLVIQALTGFALYWPQGIFGYLTHVVGGLANMRAIHNFNMWLFFSGIMVHIYMVFTEAYDQFLLMFFGVTRDRTPQRGKAMPGSEHTGEGTSAG